MAADLPAEHLQRALSDLTLTPESGQGLPTDTPALRWRTRLHQTTACTPCMTRRGIRPPVLTHRPTAPDLICPQHAIWLDGRQIHLKPLPEVLTAFRAYRRICRRHGTDHAELRNSETIVTHWFNQSRITTLNARWHNRLRTIDSTPPNAADSARRIVTLPEIVTVASHLYSSPGLPPTRATTTSSSPSRPASDSEDRGSFTPWTRSGSASSTGSSSPERIHRDGPALSPAGERSRLAHDDQT
jgi:hypothetical protein